MLRLEYKIMIFSQMQNNQFLLGMLVARKTRNKKVPPVPMLVAGKTKNKKVPPVPMLVAGKTKNKKVPPVPILVPRPSTKVSSYAGELLGDPQSSPKVQSLAGSVLRLTRLWYFPGKMKP